MKKALLGVLSAVPVVYVVGGLVLFGTPFPSATLLDFDDADGGTLVYVGAFHEGRPKGRGVAVALDSRGWMIQVGEFSTVLKSTGFLTVAHLTSLQEGYFWTGRGTRLKYRDERFAEGVAETVDGTREEGEFRNEKLHGEGVRTRPDGTREEGEFRGGKLHGQGSRTLPDGTREAGEFVDGVFQGGGG